MQNYSFASKVFQVHLIVQWLKFLVQLVPSFGRLSLLSYYGAKSGAALEQKCPRAWCFSVAYIYLIFMKLGTLKN